MKEWLSTKADLKNCRTGAGHKTTSNDLTRDTNNINNSSTRMILRRQSKCVTHLISWLLLVWPLCIWSSVVFDLSSCLLPLATHISDWKWCQVPALVPYAASYLWVQDPPHIEKLVQHLRTSCEPQSVRLFSAGGLPLRPKNCFGLPSLMNELTVSVQRYHRLPGTHAGFSLTVKWRFCPDIIWSNALQ